MARTRIGVIGLGMAVAPHAQSLIDLSDRVEVAAAFSPTEARREKFASDYGMPVCDDIRTILDDETISAVLILTPPNTHLDLVRQAAAAGKHVLLEKPLEISMERSEDLVEAAEAASTTLGVVLQHRFRPVSTALAGLVASGALGDLVSASAHLNNWRPQSYYDEPGRGTKARDGGGVLLTQAIHTLDLMISLAGLPEEVSAFVATSAVHRMQTEDMAFASVRFANGALGSIGATTAAFPGYADSISLSGTKGAARIEGTKLIGKLLDGTDILAEDGGGMSAGTGPMAFSHHHHRAVLADFLDAIAAGRAPKVSGREALRVHRLIGAILRAGESGRREAV